MRRHVMSRSKQPSPPEPDLPRIPVRLPDLRPPARSDFFRVPRTPATWPRESDPAPSAGPAAAESGPGTEEFSVPEFSGREVAVRDAGRREREVERREAERREAGRSK